MILFLAILVSLAIGYFAGALVTAHKIMLAKALHEVEGRVTKVLVAFETSLEKYKDAVRKNKPL